MNRQKILAFFIAILPIAYMYKFPLFVNNMGHAFLLFIIFPLLLVSFSQARHSHYRKYNKFYLGFSVYLLLASILAPVLFSFEGDYKSLLMAVEFSVIVFYLINDESIGQPFIDIYTILAVAFAIFLLLQYVAFVFFHVTISGVIPFLQEYDREVESILESNIIRISSVFAEPSYFAVYEIPALVMYLFNRTKQNWILPKIIIISVGILLSTSSNGIILMAFVFAAYVIHGFFSRIRVGHIILGMSIIVGAYYIISNSQFIDDVTYGLFTVEADRTESKADLRIYRGFNMYADLSTGPKIFGVGWKNAGAYCSRHEPNIFNKYYIDNYEYCNSIAGSLIYSGVLGCFLLLLFFYSLFQASKDIGSKTLVLCVFILLCTSSVLMTDQWILFLTTIIALINIKRDEKSNNSIIT